MNKVRVVNFHSIVGLIGQGETGFFWARQNDGSYKIEKLVTKSVDAMVSAIPSKEWKEFDTFEEALVAIPDEVKTEIIMMGVE